MNKIKSNPLVRVLASIKLTITLLAAFAIAAAVATFLEVRWGTEGARVLVYNAGWFEILLVLLVINLIVSLLVHMPYRRHQTGYVITHISFILVLLSSGITRYFGYEGSMHIREGSYTDFMQSTREYIQVATGGESARFPIRLYKPGENSIGRSVHVGGHEYDVKVTEYWPHFERRMIESPGGEPVIVYTATGMSGQQASLTQGQKLDVEGVAMEFLEEDRDDLTVGSAYGSLVVNLDGKTHRLAVPGSPPAEIEAGGYRFRIVKLAPAFRVGADPSPTDPMTNPAITVEIENPQGEKGERMLFAFHPDFDMGHSGGGADFKELDMTYHYSRAFYFFTNEAGGLSGRADFTLVSQQEEHSDEDHIEPQDITAGERFDIIPGMVYHAGSFAILVKEFWPSAVEEAALSTNENAPSAARIEVTDASGARAEAIIRKYDDEATVDVGGRAVSVSYGPIRIDLPYRLYLDDFLLVTYPGSSNPASYESHVKIVDQERGVDGRPVRIYMNHPLDYRGYKHFQSSYDRDNQGTILSVNHDPGKLPTYFAYTLLTIGLLITLTRGLVWMRPPKGQRGA